MTGRAVLRRELERFAAARTVQLPACRGGSRSMKDPRQLSQAELDEYLDQLVRDGDDDSPEFHRAYQLWEELNG